MPDFTLADILGAQAGAPGPAYEGGPVGNVTLADVLGPSWLDRAQKQAQADAAAYQRGGVPSLLADRGETADLAGGFGGTTIGKPLGIRAYHGSPYDFDKFDLSKIGSGEGAQSYGHGLYFAESPAVAGDYKRKLSASPTSLSQDIERLQISGQPLRSRFDIDNLEDFSKLAASGDKAGLEKLVGDRLSRWQELAGDKAYQFPDYARDKIATYEGLAKALQGGETVTHPMPPQGRMYEVDINARPEQFLDWDKPLSQQPEAVRRAIGAEGTGADAYQRAALNYNQMGGMPAVSQVLNEAGIPGIKYLDQRSRNIPPLSPNIGGSAGLRITAKENPTSNYVVFNPDIVDIRKKWALLLAAMGGAGVPTMGSVLQSQSQPQ